MYNHFHLSEGIFPSCTTISHFFYFLCHFFWLDSRAKWTEVLAHKFEWNDGPSAISQCVDGQMMSDGWATPSRPPIATPTLPTICARPSKHAINCPKIMFYTTCRKLRNSREVGQKREKKRDGMGKWGSCNCCIAIDGDYRGENSFVCSAGSAVFVQRFLAGSIGILNVIGN